MPVLAISNQKGGVAKTTTAVNLAAFLTARGHPVLAIDADPQGSLTHALGVALGEGAYTTYEVLLNVEQGTGFATLATDAGVMVVPASPNLAGAESALQDQPGRELLLRRALAATTEQYAYVVIDCPPALNLLTVNALCAADAVIVPLQAQGLSLRAMPQLEDTIAFVRPLNPRLAIGGIVLTMTTRTRLSQAVEAQAHAQYGDLVFHTTIPTSTVLAESVAYGEPISLYAPLSAGAIAYAALATELEARYAPTAYPPRYHHTSADQDRGAANAFNITKG